MSVSVRALQIKHALAALHRANEHLAANDTHTAKMAVTFAIETLHEALDIAPTISAIEEVVAAQKDQAS